MNSVFFGDFSNREDVFKQFDAQDVGHEILFADYSTGSYEGSAFVVYRSEDDGKLYQVNGGHCSCFGLEGQWDPEELKDLAELELRKFYSMDDEAREALRVLTKTLMEAK